VKAIKSDSDSDSNKQKKVARFSGKNRGVTPSVAAPGVTHPSDATGLPISNSSPTTFSTVSNIPKLKIPGFYCHMRSPLGARRFVL